MRHKICNALVMGIALALSGAVGAQALEPKTAEPKTQPDTTGLKKDSLMAQIKPAGHTPAIGESSVGENGQAETSPYLTAGPAEGPGLAKKPDSMSLSEIEDVARAHNANQAPKKATPTGLLPPTAPPKSLPPMPGNGGASHLPQNLPPAPPHVAGAPTGSDPNQDKAEIPFSPGFNPAYNRDTLDKMLFAEIERLRGAVGAAFHIGLIRTDQPEYQQYVAMGLLKRDLNQYAQQEHGLSAVLVRGGAFNGRQGPICYVLYQPDKAEHIWNNFIVPLARGNHPQTGGAYLAGHEVGHCLDQHERGIKLDKKMQWKYDDLESVGLRPEAVSEVLGGMSFSKDAIKMKNVEIMNHPAQRQYTERVADAFAAAWIVKLGANKEIAFSALRHERSKHSAGGSHQTAPILDYLNANMADVQRVHRVDILWDLARHTQRAVGIHPDAVTHKNRAMGAGDDTQSGGPPKVARWVVGPRGPVPVDAQGREIPQAANAQTNQGRNFNELPRFGSKK